MTHRVITTPALLLALALLLCSVVAFGLTKEEEEAQLYAREHPLADDPSTSGEVGTNGGAVVARCALFSSCAECVFDATVGIMTEYLNCTWCPTTSTCVPTMDTFNTSLMCPQAQYQGNGGQCPEMKCVAAEDWTNVYFCRPATRAYLALSFLLLIISAFYYFFWLRTILQKPWVYPGIHQAVDEHVNNGKGAAFLAELRTDERATDNVMVSSPSLNRKRANSSNSMARDATFDDAASFATATEADDNRKIECQICKIRTKTGGDVVCFWCDVTRLAWLPLVVSVTVAGFVIFCIFLAGLKPWFADLYYAVVLFLGYGSYAAILYVVMVHRVPVVGDREERLSTFTQLGIVLRGRQLLKVFPQLEAWTADELNVLEAESEVPAEHQKVQVEEFEMAPPAVRIEVTDPDLRTAVAEAIEKQDTKTSVVPDDDAEAPPVQISALTQSFANPGSNLRVGFAAETVPAEASYVADKEAQDTKPIPPLLRAELKSNEELLWCFEPARRAILIDNMWVLWVFISITFVGVWFFTSAMVDTSYQLRRIASPTAFTVLGVIFFVGGSFTFWHLYISATKYYALTTERLIIVSQAGPRVIVDDTDIDSVKCASIQTYVHYRGFSRAAVVQSFSWTAPEEGRRLPPIRSTIFVGLTPVAMIDLISQFNNCLMTEINSNAIKDDFAHNRYAWRIHTIFNVLVLVSLPIFLMHSYVEPLSVAFLGFLAVAQIPLCFIFRAIRVHTTTVDRHNVKMNDLPAWGRGHAGRRRRGWAMAIPRFLSTANLSSPLGLGRSNKSPAKSAH